MTQLKHSKIYRGGVTAPSISFETSECTADVDRYKGTLDISFNLASKGGGQTHVIVQIGKGDLHVVLQEIANKLPESVGMLSDCASIAYKKNLALLESVQAGEKARAKSLADDLELVEQFVSQKYATTPAGEVESEERVRDLLQEAISSLRDFE